MNRAPRLPTLVTIPFSHYCEKARWALARAAIPFREAAHLPFFHAIAVRRWGGTRTVPILATPAGILPNSTAILHYADEALPEPLRLFPSETGLRAEVEQLVSLFDSRVGTAARRIAYFHLLPEKKALQAMLARNAEGLEARVAQGCFPLFAFGIQKGVGVDAPRTERSQVALEGVLDQLDARLSDGRKRLTGDRFTAADLTFASLLAPLLLPPELAPMYGTIDELPATLKPIVAALRERPAGRLALRVYAEERNRNALQ